MKQDQKIKGHVIGIDWGASKCGLAVGDVETGVASAMGQCEENDLLETVENLNKDFDSDIIIIGYAEHQGLKNNSRRIEKIKKIFKKKGYEVCGENEMFSTQMARRNLMDADKKNISKQDNAESARIILQGWLDKRG